MVYDFKGFVVRQVLYFFACCSPHDPINNVHNDRDLVAKR